MSAPGLFAPCFLSSPSLDSGDGGAAPAFIDRAITIIIHKTSKGFWHFLPYLLAKGTLVNLALQRAKKTRAFLAELGIKPESAGRVPESGRGSSAQVHATI